MLPTTNCFLRAPGARARPQNRAGSARIAWAFGLSRTRTDQWLPPLDVASYSSQRARLHRSCGRPASCCTLHAAASLLPASLSWSQARTSAASVLPSGTRPAQLSPPFNPAPACGRCGGAPGHHATFFVRDGKLALTALGAGADCDVSAALTPVFPPPGTCPDIPPLVCSRTP